LKRLMNFLLSTVAKLELRDTYRIKVPKELAHFLTTLEGLTVKNISSKSPNSDFAYWQTSWAAKEKYRERVWPGFSGAERALTTSTVKRMLHCFLAKIERGLAKGVDKKTGITYSYYINDVTKFAVVYEKGRRKVNANGLPLLRALSFRHRPMSLFLEGPMHAMRLMSSREASSLHRAIRRSKIFDRKLRMYKINEPLKDMPIEIGRSAIFTPGWLENESIWLHMEYKYMLELLKRGLYSEFFADMKRCLVAYQDPRRYGRSNLENCSFIASSAYPDARMHGNGFVARLTGTTTEFLTMWSVMCLGKDYFELDRRRGLLFCPRPILPDWLFTGNESPVRFSADGVSYSFILPKNTFSFCIFAKTLCVYHNPKRLSTFGENAASPVRFVLHKKGYEPVTIVSDVVPSPYAQRIRGGFYERIDIELA